MQYKERLCGGGRAEVDVGVVVVVVGSVGVEVAVVDESGSTVVLLV